MTSLDHLLPAAEEAIRCADHARRLAIDPGGTAIRADRLVVVETGLPWPKPVFDHPTLREIDPLLKTAPRVTRLLACQPDTDPATAGPATMVWVFDRLDTATRERRFAVSSPDELQELTGCLVAEVPGDQLTSGAVQPIVDREMTEPAVLVCTQGSHDICCGSDGARLAVALEAMTPTGPRQRPMRVFRVSHTGGHRFAPTAMTLPDGRMWAYLGLDMVTEILSGSADAGRLAPYCRGWWGADRGPAQMAERAVLAETGFALDHARRTVAEVSPGVFSVDVDGGAAGHGSWTVAVELAREVPTISCRQPGGRPHKVAREYTARIIQPPQTLQ